MTSSSGIPRPFSITDAKRAREEEARKREQATSARNTSSTTIGSGGRLDVVGGDLTISDGGNASVKDGGAFRVEGGGSMEIVDDGEVIITGSTYDALSDVVRVAQVALRTEEITHENVEWTTRRPGIFFSTDGVEGSSIRSFIGSDASMVSGIAPVTWGPLVETDVNKSTSVYVSPGNAVLSAGAFYKTGAEMTDSRAHCALQVDPDAIFLQLYRSSVGEMGFLRVSIADPVMRLGGRAGTDIKGPFTVDGAPVGGAVDSVAGKTGAVTLVKSDVGLGNVDNTSDAAKPVSTATATALSGKASTAVATTTVNGLMASTDKSKLDNSTASAAALRLIQRDSLGRAQVADPAVAADIATKGYVDAAVSAAPTALPLARGKLSIAGPVAAGGVSGSVAVTFPAGLFTGEPIITFGTNDPRVSPNIIGLSASGCSIRAFNYTTAATTASPAIWWIAVQS